MPPKFGTKTHLSFVLTQSLLRASTSVVSIHIIALSLLSRSNLSPPWFACCSLPDVVADRVVIAAAVAFGLFRGYVTLGSPPPRSAVLLGSVPEVASSLLFPSTLNFYPLSFSISFSCFNEATLLRSRPCFVWGKWQRKWACSHTKWR